MASCGRAGLLPCGPELQPEAGQMVQVLTFQRAGRQVYTERIMAENGAFADPLPEMRPPSDRIRRVRGAPVLLDRTKSATRGTISARKREPLKTP